MVLDMKRSWYEKSLFTDLFQKLVKLTIYVNLVGKKWLNFVQLANIFID